MLTCWLFHLHVVQICHFLHEGGWTPASLSPKNGAATAKSLPRKTFRIMHLVSKKGRRLMPSPGPNAPSGNLHLLKEWTGSPSVAHPGWNAASQRMPVFDPELKSFHPSILWGFSTLEGFFFIFFVISAKWNKRIKGGEFFFFFVRQKKRKKQHSECWQFMNARLYSTLRNYTCFTLAWVQF